MLRHVFIFLSLFLLSTPILAAEMPTADYVDPTTGMEFVSIPGGTFMMGNNDDMFAKPEHEVTVQPFLIGRYEVTFDQYAAFCKATKHPIPADSNWGMGSRPVINISWEDSVAFTDWLSKKSGRTFRLPSEAEWEYAARGGTTSPFPWGEGLGRNKANCRDCGSEWDGEMTAPVGSFAPNGFGLYDMIGNVYEWCLDAMKNSYEGAPTDGSALVEGGNTQQRIDRGGSWYRGVKEMTVFRRCWDNFEQGSKEIGFRVVLEQ